MKTLLGTINQLSKLGDDFPKKVFNTAKPVLEEAQSTLVKITPRENVAQYKMKWRKKAGTRLRGQELWQGWRKPEVIEDSIVIAHDQPKSMYDDRKEHSVISILEYGSPRHDIRARDDFYPLVFPVTGKVLGDILTKKMIKVRERWAEKFESYKRYNERRAKLSVTQVRKKVKEYNDEIDIQIEYELKVRDDYKSEAGRIQKEKRFETRVAKLWVQQEKRIARGEAQIARIPARMEKENRRLELALQKIVDKQQKKILDGESKAWGVLYTKRVSHPGSTWYRGEFSYVVDRDLNEEMWKNTIITTVEQSLYGSEQ